MSALSKSTKIVATIGPASFDAQIQRQMLEAGVNVFRLNFSHGTKAEKVKTITQIRALSTELSQSVAIIADLQGPKFRLGETADHQPIHLNNGQTVYFESGESKEQPNKRYCTPEVLVTGTSHAHTLIPHLREGHRILINDGAIVLKVEQRIVESQSNNQSIKLKCSVVVGGPCGERKGVNVPDIEVPLPALTDKDREDAEFAFSQGVEYMALSFVQRASDVTELREFIRKLANRAATQSNNPTPRILPKIISKIEKPQALQNIDSIIEASDCVMVARGDLGVESSYWRVPVAQRLLIQKCRAACKPVIVATQMLESMIENASPTRAEVSDVFNAVREGADATMLSGESAAGKYPVRAVQAMAQIVKTAENNFRYKVVRLRNQPSTDKTTNHFIQPVDHLTPPVDCSLDFAIASASVAATLPSSHISSMDHIAALVLVTVNYDFPLYVSKMRPRCPIIVVTFDEKLANQIELLYGCHALVIDESEQPSKSQPSTPYSSTDTFLPMIERCIESHGWLKTGDVIVLACADAPTLGMKHSLSMAEFGSWKKHERENKQTNETDRVRWTSMVQQHTRSKL